jgi:hypothetical protein
MRQDSTKAKEENCWTGSGDEGWQNREARLPSGYVLIMFFRFEEENYDE